jgi:hypothetical protein
MAQKAPFSHLSRRARVAVANNHAAVATAGVLCEVRSPECPAALALTVDGPAFTLGCGSFRVTTRWVRDARDLW